MTDMAHEPALWAAKAGGAVAGALISLVYLLPKSGREAAGRFFIGVLAGLIFGGAAGAALADGLDVAARLTAFETLLMGSTAASLGAWWVLGVLARIAERWGH